MTNIVDTYGTRVWAPLHDVLKVMDVLILVDEIDDRGSIGVVLVENGIYVPAETPRIVSQASPIEFGVAGERKGDGAEIDDHILEWS